MALQATVVMHLAVGPGGPLGLGDEPWQCWRDRVLAAVDGCNADQPDNLGPDNAVPRRLRPVFKTGGMRPACPVASTPTPFAPVC